MRKESPRASLDEPEESVPSPGSEPRSPLGGLAALAREAESPALAAAAEDLAERVREGRFYVACVGQFKRGKSTLLNALVGHPILPVGVVPVTTVVTVLRHGATLGARVQAGDGPWRAVSVGDLASYVSENGNPNNEKDVRGVEVYVPSPLLSEGMCLVDTPGVGSVFDAATEATHRFVPHIDAAIVVVGGDPPISADEAELVERVAGQVDELLVVLNKADRMDDGARREARAFTERVLLERLGRSPGPVLEVSALERSRRVRGGARDWEALVARLRDLGAKAGSRLVAGAERRGLSVLSERLLAELDEREAALLRPIEETARHVEVLRRCVRGAEESMAELAHRFEAAREQLNDRFRKQRETFLSETLPAARQELEKRIRTAPERGPRLRRTGYTAAWEIFSKAAESWRRDVQPRAEEMFRESARRFVDLANEFLDELKKSGVPELSRLRTSFSPEVGFRTESRLYFTELASHTDRGLLGWLLDAARPRGSLVRSVERRARDYLDSLLRTNANRMHGDLNELVLESRRRLEEEIRQGLEEVCNSASRALEAARVRKAEGQEAVAAELEKIRSIRARALPLVRASSARADSRR